MKNLELSYDDYIEEAIFSKKADPDGEKKIKELYDMLEDYNKAVENGDNLQYISIGYSPEFGYYTYSKVDRDNYQLMKLGKDKEAAFLKIVINDIEFQKAVAAENWDKEKYVDRFEMFHPGVEYSSCSFYAGYIMNKLKRYFKNNVPEYVVSYFENYLRKTTGRDWKYNGFDFYPLEKEDVKKRTRSKN